MLRESKSSSPRRTWTKVQDPALGDYQDEGVVIGEELSNHWRDLLKEIIQLPEFTFPRSTKPEHAVGPPEMIIFMDGAQVKKSVLAQFFANRVGISSSTCLPGEPRDAWTMTSSTSLA